MRFNNPKNQRRIRALERIEKRLETYRKGDKKAEKERDVLKRRIIWG